jgi:alginate production protein
MSARTRVSAVILSPMARTLAVAWLGILLLPVAALAGSPEYMKLPPRIGLGVEIEGELSRDGFFEASDIEPLPGPRSPKLRGELQEVDHEAGILVIFGMTARIQDDTEFEGAGWDELKAGRRAEVKIKTDGNGAWIVREVSTSGVKDNDKIKGTITAMSVDGTAPDTLSISGLKVLLVEQTDIAEALLLKDQRQRDHFGRLAATDARYLKRGHALADGKMGLRVQYRQYLRQQQEPDLSSSYDADLLDTQPQLKARWFGFWSKDVRTLVDVRARRTYVLDSDRDLYHQDPEYQLKQAYVLWRNLAGGDFAVAVGRQKIKEERQWLWDEYLEAVRLYYYGSDRVGLQVTYIDPTRPLKEKFDTWRDLYLGAEFYPGQDNTFTAYLLRRWDSDEARNREPVWMGLRYLGQPLASVRAWADLAAMRGTDKHQDLEAWAFDLGATWFPDGLPWRPSLTVAYAFGSGDEHDSPGVDGEFRQTGYEDNTQRFGGVTSLQYYGAVLDPELSNLVVTTFGGGVRPLNDLSCEVYYHRYTQDWSADEVRGDLLDPPARPNGRDTDLGWGLDLVLGVRDLLGAVKASWTIGMFTPGQAYAPRQERAILNKLQFTVEI